MKRFFILLLTIITLAGCGQNEAQAAPKGQIFQTLLAGLKFDGATLAGGKVYFYSPGTATLKTIYTDRNMATPAANPYTLDSNGQAQIYGAGVYDVKVTTSAGVQKAYWYNVSLTDPTSITTVNITDYASLNAAVTSIGSTPTRLFINTATTVTGSLTIPSTLELEITKAGSINQGTYTITINGPFSAGQYQVFTGTGAITFNMPVVNPNGWFPSGQVVTFNAGLEALPTLISTGMVLGVNSKVKEIHAGWWYSGTWYAASPVWDSAIQAAVNAGSASTFPIPVILPPYVFTEGSINLPPKTILYGWGGYAGGGNSAISFPTLWEHFPVADNIDIVATSGTAQAESVEIAGIHFSDASAGTHYSRTAINYLWVIGGNIHNVGVSGPFTLAGIRGSALLDCTITKPNIGNVTSTAMLSGILFDNTIGISTTVRIDQAYIHGNPASATGGITTGVTVGQDAVFGLAIYSPIIESIGNAGWNIYKGNTVDVYNPYMENVPSTDIAWPLFRIGKDPVGAAAYATYVNIHGGALYGTNATWVNNFGFDLDQYESVNLIGSQLGRISVVQKSTNTNGSGIFSMRDCSTIGATFGTVASSQNINYESNRCDPSGCNPATSRQIGTMANLPVYHKRIGMMYFGTDLSPAQPVWWNGTFWAYATGLTSGY